MIPVKAIKVNGIRGNEITFKEILEDVDFRYSVNGSAVKEDIILNQYQNEIDIDSEHALEQFLKKREK